MVVNRLRSGNIRETLSTVNYVWSTSFLEFVRLNELSATMEAGSIGPVSDSIDFHWGHFGRDTKSSWFVIIDCLNENPHGNKQSLWFQSPDKSAIKYLIWRAMLPAATWPPTWGLEEGGEVVGRSMAIRRPIDAMRWTGDVSSKA